VELSRRPGFQRRQVPPELLTKATADAGFPSSVKQLQCCSDMSDVVLESTLSCPECSHAKEETMPTDSCQWFYECEACKTVLRPLPATAACSVPTAPASAHRSRLTRPPAARAGQSGVSARRRAWPTLMQKNV
jgi:hypothetical protein